MHISQLASIRTELGRTQDRQSLLGVASDLLAVAESLLDAPDAGTGQLNEIAGALARIRHLLGELGRGSGAGDESITALKIAERYHSLEGKVKELRNDRYARPCCNPAGGR